MAESAADGPGFDVVRRGYDIDQVREFLVRQAEAWRAELYEATRRIGELEAETAHVAELEAEVDQARIQQEAFNLSLQSATSACDELVAAAKEEASTILAEARAEAASVLAAAEREADDVRFAARARTDELVRAQESELVARRNELDTSYSDALATYERTEQSLIDKVRELNSIREALVVGLEAIASGGLSALEDVSDELAAVGIVSGDDTAIRQLVGGETLKEPMTNGHHLPQ